MFKLICKRDVLLKANIYLSTTMRTVAYICGYVSLGEDRCKSLQNKSCSSLFVLQEWLEAADTRAELLRYLKEQVPQIFCLKTESSPLEEEELMQNQLLHPLECFLFGEDPQEGLEKLKQGCTSSQLCGRVFKEGETVYSCRSE